jgi:hypothetical protein
MSKAVEANWAYISGQSDQPTKLSPITTKLRVLESVDVVVVGDVVVGDVVVGEETAVTPSVVEVSTS